MTDRLGKPPYRIAGNPPGIISADDYDVTDEALALLAAVEALYRAANGDSETFGGSSLVEALTKALGEGA